MPTILEFPAGLPGFEDTRRYELIERVGAAPLLLLQNLDAAGPCFLAVPVTAIAADYSLDVAPDDLARLGVDHITSDLLCLAILSAPENGPLTANLLAPVVVEPRTFRAVQAVRADTKYSHQYILAAAAPEAPCS